MISRYLQPGEYDIDPLEMNDKISLKNIPVKFNITIKSPKFQVDAKGLYAQHIDQLIGHAISNLYRGGIEEDSALEISIRKST